MDKTQLRSNVQGTHLCVLQVHVRRRGRVRLPQVRGAVRLHRAAAGAARERGMPLGSGAAPGEAELALSVDRSLDVSAGKNAGRDFVMPHLGSIESEGQFCACQGK